MKKKLTTTTKTIITKISSLTIYNTGVILVKTKQECLNISFAEIEKVYIKKSKLSFIDKSGIVSFLLILLFNSILFMPKELVLISLFLYLPIIVYIEKQ